MRSGRFILAVTLLSLFTSIGFSQPAKLPKELRPLLQPAPAMRLATGTIQVVDLRSPPAAGPTTALATPAPPVLAARRAGPATGRSLATNELAEALRGAQMALATQNVYATLTPGHLVIEDKAVTRIYSGISRIGPEAIYFFMDFGAGRGAHVEVTLRNSGVYLVDYTYSYYGNQSVECSIGHAGVSQTVWLNSWRDGEDASHVVVAVNYTAPSQWPDTGASYSAVQLYCYPREGSTGFLYLYSINVVKP